MARKSSTVTNSWGESLGEFIAEQRRNASLSMRQLAELAGVSNPYLSQIERGLRRPSAEVLQQLAKALRVSAESLYVRAGILSPDDDGTTDVTRAVLSDTAISERQKQALLEVYAAFVHQHTASTLPTQTPRSSQRKEKTA
ncbi:helix-turn-helix domain-containing protein [Naumannella sp. ID2617S]|uniref:XRE family transcriptional regulator n=1 Tax=Enemella dayhoffiae TaxID=2016507 RepID=A0A255H596_9ACTN|nr:helix-turn-helix transcriptional regulator [Enemella dayhoffiae]NNG20739.1 helix-turn-helix domain-containing protein [Naumannella sp. ID2617S]OYO22831.1 XRE family transcriptional regulator [Enemella dayhoffiae]